MIAGVAIVAASLLLASRFALAQTPPLLKEGFSREYSILVGGEQTPLVKDVSSREVSLYVGGDGLIPCPQAISREMSVVITTIAAPQRVTQLTVGVSPTGDAATLQWCDYNEVAQNDVVRYRIYVSTAPFTTVSNLTPYAIVPAGTCTFTITNLTAWQDHYFAVVAEDALGGSDPTVNYSAAYVLAPEAVSREYSLFVGGEPTSPYAQVITRETSVLITTPAFPQHISQLAISVTPTGDGATLDWSAYNEIAQNDVVRYNIYISSTPFITVSNLTPYVVVPAGTFSLTVSNLTAWQDHYFAVVPVDGLGGYDPVVNYSAAYVIAAQATSREFSLFVGGSPVAGNAEAISREVSMVVPDAAVPDPVTGLTNGFQANTSVAAYSAIDLDWSSYNEVAQQDVVRYRIYVGSSFYTDVSAITPYEYVSAGTFRHTVHGLYGGAIYYLAVVAEDALGNWNPTVRSVSAQASIGALGDVQNLAVTCSSNALHFTWSPPAQVDAFLARYNVYFNGSTNPVVLAATATSYDATGLQPSTGYPFRISTVDTFGTESAGVPLMTATLLNNPSPVATQSFDQIVRLTWTHVEPNNLVKTYNIYKSSSSFTTVAGMTPVATTRGTRADVGGLVNGTSYFFAVTTVNIVNGENQLVRTVSATPNPVSGSFADLAITNVAAPISAYAGQTISVQWAVTNVGANFTSASNGTAVNSWNDRVVFSPDNVYGDADDIVVANVLHTGGLGVGGGYAGTAVFPLATNLAGYFYVFVLANADGHVYEALDYGPDLGVALQPIYINPSVPPAITQQPSNQIVYQGRNATFSVVAQGAQPLFYQWRHGVTPLPAGTNATLVLTNVQYSDAGSYSVQVSNVAGSTNSSAATLTVNPPPPDLLTLGIQSPTNVLAGQPVVLSWLVTNAGASTAVAPWQETLYLANNPAGTNGSVLLNFVATNSLNASNSVVRTQSVIIPAGLPGSNYWLAIQMDSANQVAEDAGEPNNFFVAAQPIQIQSPDLAVISTVSPLTVSLGQQFSVSWTATNFGNGAAIGPWMDRVWLSTSSTSIAGATLLASSATPTTSLSAASSYTNTASLAVALNGQTQPGNYWLIVQADALNSVPEANETNNLRVVPLTLTLPPLPDLVVGMVSSSTSALAGQSIPVSWAVTNVGAASANGAWQESVYLTTNGVALSQFRTNLAAYPLLGTFTFTSSLASAQSVTRTQQVIVPLNGLAGSLRVGVVVDSGNSLVEQNETNNAALATNVLQVPLALTLYVPVTNVLENTSASNLNCSVSRNGDLSSPLNVTFGNTATNHLQVPASVTIPAGVTTAPFSITVLDDGIPNSNTLVTITANAGGYLSATSQVMVVNMDLPSLILSLGSSQITQGQTLIATVSCNPVSSQPVGVSIASSSTTALSVPSPVTIPANSNSVTFTLLAVQNTVIAPTQTYSVSVSAAGYSSSSASLTVLNSNAPSLTLSLDRTNVNETDGPFAAVATVTRQPITDQPVTFALSSTNLNAARVTAQITIPALQGSVGFYVSAVNDTNVTGPKLTLISAQALDILGNPVGSAATASLEVEDNNGPVLKVLIANKIVPKGTNPATSGRVWINAPTTNDLVITLEPSATNEATVPATVTIPAGQTNATFAIASLNDGIQSSSHNVVITASATNYASGNDTLTVTDRGQPDLVIPSVTVPGAVDTGQPLTVGFRLKNQGFGALTNGATQNVYFTTNPISGSYVLTTTAYFPGPLGAGQYADQTLVIAASSLPSPGMYWVSVTANANNYVAELNYANNNAISSTPVVISAQYAATVKAGVTNVLMGTAVPLTGSATLTAGGPATNVPVNIVLAVRGLQRIISVTTDSNGNFSTVFTPLAYEAGTYNVSAVLPGITNAPPQDQFNILGMSANPSSLALAVVAGGATAETVSLQNLSDVPLTGLTATINGAAANLNPSATLSTNSVAGQGSLSLTVALSASDASITHSSFTTHLTSAEGMVFDLPVSITVNPLTPRFVSTPGQINASMLRGAQAIVQFDVINTGGAWSGPLTVSVPTVPWLGVATINPLPAIAPGQTNHVTLLLSPGTNLALGPYTGVLAVNDSSAGLQVPFTFTAVSDAHGALRVRAVDEFTFFAAGAPPLTNASVKLIEPFSRSIVATGITDTAGQLLMPGVMEGIYELDVTADKHASFRGSATVTAGTTNDVETFLSRQTVSFIWTVVPTQIQDVTHITVRTEFEANVPAPVVVPIPASLDLTTLQQPGQFMDVPLTLANYGLIAVHHVNIHLSGGSLYQFDLLTQNIGDLPAHGTVTVPMRITRLANSSNRSFARTSSSTSCPWVVIAYDYQCGAHGVGREVSIQVTDGEGGDCGGGGGDIFLVGCNDCPGGAVIYPSGTESGSGSCDPCMQKARVECAIGFIPTVSDYYAADSCIWSFAGVLTGGGQPGGEAAAETCLVSYIGWAAGYIGAGYGGPIGGLVAGAVANLGACELSFLHCKCPDSIFSSNFWSCVRSGQVQHTQTYAAKDATAGLGLSITDPRDVYAARCVPQLQSMCMIVGDTDGRWFSPGSGAAFGAWFGLFYSAIQTNSPSGSLISTDEAATLLAAPRPNTVTDADVQNAISRWNLSLSNWRSGIYSITNVPPGGNTNFIDVYALGELMVETGDQVLAAQAAGYDSPQTGFFAALQDAENKTTGGGVCAHVILQLDQDAVLTRDAFSATLQLNNNGSDPLQNISINLVVQNASGQNASGVFGIQPPTLAGDLGAVDGTGVLQPNGAGSGQWTIIPTLDAAPQVPTKYLVSGTFNYTLNGAAISIPLSPTPIMVQPNPQLYVKYFHQRDVFADDPFTPAIEPSIPYSLAVMVQNRGYGIAHDFRITSAQPKIVDNEKGLLVDFKIIGAQVGNQSVSPSLTADFGDIAPGGIGIGRWLLTSTLQGLFINYKATFEHVDPLGNPRLSLIDGVEIHEMIHLVRADGAWDDGLPDFLVNDVADFNYLPDTLYLSDGTIQPVSVVQDGIPDAPASVNHLQVQFTANFPAGFAYLLASDPANGKFPLLDVQRSNGISLFTENFYTTDRTFIGLGQRPIRENMLHLFDYHTNAGPDTYTLIYGLPSNAIVTNPPVSAVFSLPVQSPPIFGVVWSGATYVGAASLAYFDIFVSDNDGPFTVWQSQTTATGALFNGTNGHTYAFYSLATDTAGHREAIPLQPQAQTTVALNTIPPTISITPKITLNAGETLSLNVTADSPNQLNTLTFSLLPGAPSGVVVNPTSGQITWPTSPAFGGTTNLISVIVNDNGQPPLSATGMVTVVLLQVANPPVLASIPNYRIYEAQLLTTTNSASDDNLPPRPLTFSLGAGAPTNATINAVTGVFQWQPTAAQAPSTNIISVIVIDNGTPPLSATQQFTVIVRPVAYYYTLSLGSTNVLVGGTSSVPVSLNTSLPLTNITTFVQVPATQLTNLTLSAVSAEILSTLLQPLGTNQYAISLSLNPALNPGNARTLAQLGFTAVPETNSSIATLLLSQLSAVQANGQTAAKPGAFGGRVFIIGRQPLLDAWLGTNASRMLTLYGNPGASYQIAENTNLLLTNWLPVWRVPMTNQFKIFGADQAAPQIFYRSWEFFADPPIIDLNSFTGTNLTLLLYGKGGTNYMIEATTNLSSTNGWFPATNLILTNSFQFIGTGNPTNNAMFFRAKRP